MEYAAYMLYEPKSHVLANIKLKHPKGLICNVMINKYFEHKL